MKSIIVPVFILFLTDLKEILCQDFGYDGDKGPIHWGEQYNTCKGKYQSPINIDRLSVKRVVLVPLKFEGFDVPPEKTNVTNNGHTVMVTLDAEIKPSLSGGPLRGVYEFSQFHFHWGRTDTEGSEDTIDSKSFPMELHMVFYKKMYRNARSAIDHPDGLTVLAFFFEISGQDNLVYEEFTMLLQNVTEPKMSTEFLNPPNLKDLLSTDLVHYYTYNGSLTTPPCSEVVTWIDFEQPILLSHNQLEMFRSLQNEEGHTLNHNFRPIQPLGDRIVLYNDEKNELDNHLYNTENEKSRGIQSTESTQEPTRDSHNNDLFGNNTQKSITDIINNTVVEIATAVPSKTHNKKSHSSRNSPVFNVVITTVFCKLLFF